MKSANASNCRHGLRTSRGICDTCRCPPTAASLTSVAGRLDVAAYRRLFSEAQVVGIDLREQGLDYARARARDEGLRNLTFGAGDVFALPFPDASFDVVWSKYLLQWLREPKSALAEMKRVTKPGGFVVSCDYAGFGIEHYPIAAQFERQLREPMSALVDVNIGRKVAPLTISLGFSDVLVEVVTDTLFMVIGGIDPERRWNWQTQLQAARQDIVQIVELEFESGRAYRPLPAHYDDPATCSYTALYFTRCGAMRAATSVRSRPRRVQRPRH